MGGVLQQETQVESQVAQLVELLTAVPKVTGLNLGQVNILLHS